MILRPMSFRISASDRKYSPSHFTAYHTIRLEAPTQGGQQQVLRHQTEAPPAASPKWVELLERFFQTIGKVIRIEVVCEWTSLSRSTVYERIDKDSPRHDPTFPLPFPLTGDRAPLPSRLQLETNGRRTQKNKEAKTQGAVGWSSVEVCLWIAAQAAKREGGLQ